MVVIRSFAHWLYHHDKKNEPKVGRMAGSGSRLGTVQHCTDSFGDDRRDYDCVYRFAVDRFIYLGFHGSSADVPQNS